MPFINWLLFVAVILLVVGFRNSDNLGGGVRHRGDARDADRLDPDLLRDATAVELADGGAVAIAVPLIAIDLAFLTSNALKIPDGGWFPIVIGIVVFTLLTTWKRGRIVLMARLAEDACRSTCSSRASSRSPPMRVPGTAVFLTSAPDRVPHALLHNLKHNKVLHERVVFLTIVTRDIPYVPPRERYEIKPLGGDVLPDRSRTTASRRIPTCRALLEDRAAAGSRSR